jgi:hypothetical protein
MSPVSTSGGCSLAPPAAANPNGTADGSSAEPTIEMRAPDAVSVRRGAEPAISIGQLRVVHGPGGVAEPTPSQR